MGVQICPLFHEKWVSRSVQICPDLWTGRRVALPLHGMLQADHYSPVWEAHMAQNAAQATRALRIVLDPRGQPTAVVQPSPLAPRLESIEGKTIYLVDIGFGGGWEFLEEAAAWLHRRFPSIKTELRHKRGNMFLEDPALFAEIKIKGDAVIFGVGG
jgi:hypothetical protein